MRRSLVSGFLVAAAVIFGPALLDAVLVAPHAVFIDHRARTGVITLANPSGDVEEIEIDLVFGYPETDSSGNPYVRLHDTPPPDAPSAAGWVEAFPRRVRLDPGQRQVVRLLATPPANLTDGEYWSRIVVTSRRAGAALTGADTTVRAGITLELRTIISLAYRKGDLQTGVALTDLSSRVEGDTAVVWVALAREGNAAYLGTVRFRLVDDPAAPETLAETPVAVYYTQRRRFALPLDSLTPGRHQVRLEIDTARDDLRSADVLPAPPITRTFAVRVP